MEDLASSLERVRERIANAAARSRRNPAEIVLLAVTKVFPASVICEAHALGLREFGENYVQEFESKLSTVGGLAGARFHLIGHLQSNKANRVSEIFGVIQTVDSEKLARRLNEAGRKLEVMIEVKLSAEETKYGVEPGAAPALVSAIRGCSNLELTGLMTIPEWSDDPEKSRASFAALRKLGSELSLPKLSMGMSHDLEVAIEEGSTMVRVGTALFGKRRRA